MGFFLLEELQILSDNCLTNTLFLYIVNFNFLRQAVQKGLFSISELAHICFLMHLLFIIYNSYW